MDTSQVIKAHEVAKKAHFGQIDRAGIDYIKHPETVASFVATDEEKAVAYLHDVIEDTSLTLLDLKKEGFSKNIRLVRNLVHFIIDDGTN
ncbi:guanosine polyphosphate pyrophosphohydrolases/synthetases (COG0317) [Streptococcus pneumoniae]|nr:guanosine polyphosphate pyrophosphohydrolases/synthetases (COG0317) [Streptococcus pneumoniae]VKA34228.1 guanosine polyphosphate pyrophosphohydrolases/synthetases (COG0317) [Streptococcus pneumoniae]VKJ07404.1 guanosine polyphosphate pyrophosphohydrolases/synthetases (COG0317) [Streptococcus pneumoniae]VKN79324.1 guanosine polyphosphate pyrophosphohydrolases/synthetases (COG0317) [Streptococcus pneumoniae]VNY54207.1 guanosine polyphosphate pyrophosphohydrolases/synthetases (COG0317) [Strepto